MLDKDEPLIIQVIIDSHAPLSFDSLEENVPHIEITLFALCLIQSPISDLILILQRECVREASSLAPIPCV